jgi:hypothetical protein
MDNDNSVRILKETISRNISIAQDGGRSSSYPCSAKDGEGRLWVIYQSFHDGERETGDYIYARNFDGDDWGGETRLSRGGMAHKPFAVADSDGRIWAAWSEAEGDGFDVFVSRCDQGAWSEPLRVTSGHADCVPCLAADSAGNVAVAWMTARTGQAQIGLRLLDRQMALGPEVLLASPWECYRPFVLYDQEDRLLVAFDAFDRSRLRYDVYLSVFEGGRFTEPAPLNDVGAPYWSTAPYLAKDSKRVYAAWETHGNTYYVAYHLARLEQGKPVRTERIFANLFDTHSISLYVDDRERLWIAFNMNRKNVCIQMLDGDTWNEPRVFGHEHGTSRRPLVAQDGNGDFWFIGQGTQIRGGNTNERNAYLFGKYVKAQGLAALASMPLAEGAPKLAKLTPEQTDRQHGVQSSASNRERVVSRVGEYYVYWGDPHTHSVFSDGNKTVDMLFNFQKHVSRMSFGAVTDHTEYPDKLTDSEFHMIKMFNRLMEDETFKPLHAFEWTSNEWMWNYGHKNVYFPHSDAPIMRTTDRRYNNPDKLFAAVEKYGGLVPAHHPSAMWMGPDGFAYSAYNDWSYGSDSAESVVEICSHWGVSEYYGNPGGVKFEIPHNHIQDVLRDGRHLGFVGGTDTHGGTPGQEGGITGVLAKSLTQEAIIEAMHSRRTIASQGSKVAVDFRLNGQEMGSIVQLNGGERRLTIRLEAPDFDAVIDQVILIKNNEEIAVFELHQHQGSFEYVDAAPAGTASAASGQAEDYYYLRICMADGSRVWASPIWVRRG